MNLSWRREPTLYLQALQVLLVLLVAFRVFGFTDELSAQILAVAGAVIGAINAAKTRPIAPAAFTAVITAAAPLLAHFRLHLGAEQVGALQFAIVFVLAYLVRGQVTPSVDPAPTTPGTGPVR